MKKITISIQILFIIFFVSGCYIDPHDAEIIDPTVDSTIPVYTISFITHTDEVIEDVVFTSFEDLNLTNHYREGYVFYGWRTPDDILFTNESIVDSNLTLSIKWVAFEDALEGDDFGDDYFGVNGFLADYYYNSGQLAVVPDNPKEPYQPFEDFLVEIGGDQNFTEARFIEFMARDLKANNPIKYRNLRTNEEYLLDEIDDTNRVRLYTTEKLWVNSEGVYFIERIVNNENDDVYTEYVETSVLTRELNEDNILLSKDGLISFDKQEFIQKYQDQYYLRVDLNGARRYLNLNTLEVVSIPFITSVISTEGPIYQIGEDLYSYIEPGLFYIRDRIQYKSTSFTEDFRKNILNTYSRTFNRFDSLDYSRLMLRILYQINPSQFSNLFYHPDFTFDYSALNNALIGSATASDPLSNTFILKNYISYLHAHHYKS